jgi:regulator of PEP synthase PpsR (kinase-PPPase family)
LPRVVHDLDQRRIFGLTIDPQSLHDIRKSRVLTIGVPGRTNYDDMDYILAELDWSEELFRAHPTWPVIDVTRTAVEETAALILGVLSARGLDHGVGEVGQL